MNRLWKTFDNGKEIWCYSVNGIKGQVNDKELAKIQVMKICSACVLHTKCLLHDPLFIDCSRLKK